MGLAPDRSLLEMGLDEVPRWQMAEGAPQVEIPVTRNSQVQGN